MSGPQTDGPVAGPPAVLSTSSGDAAAELVRHALNARERAYAPYSHYLVGAALLTAGGQVVYGCNVENAAYPDTLCAERVALTAAVAMGYRDFVALAVATKDGGSPCGSCRQVLAELADGAMPVYISDAQGAWRTTTVAELLPQSFSRASLTPSPTA
jgi:cytidine deaminase